MTMALDMYCKNLFATHSDVIINNEVHKVNYASKQFHKSFGFQFTKLDRRDDIIYSIDKKQFDKKQFEVTQKTRDEKIQKYIEREDRQIVFGDFSAIDENAESLLK